jgi:RNA polymerase sigma-70 factor, ECF subfamily
MPGTPRLGARGDLPELHRGPRRQPGPFRLQAAIAACDTTAPSFAATDWRQIAAHYATLFATTGSPAARIHEAQAAAQFDDPARVLAALDAAVDAHALARYVPLHAVRGDLLERCGEQAAAAATFRLAAGHSGNDAEQRLLRARAQRAGGARVTHGEPAVVTTRQSTTSIPD